MYATKVNSQSSLTSVKGGIRAQLINIIVILIIAFSFTTIIQSLVDRISINKVVGGLLALFCGWLFLLNPEKKAFVRFIYFVFNALISLILTTSVSTELNDFIFLFATLLMLMTISNSRNIELFQHAIKRHIKIINVAVITECLILGYLLISKTGYTYHWGEGRYFQGLCNSQHTMASLSCLIIVLILYLAKNYKNYVVYGLLALIPSYAIFETGARVFLVPLMILLFLFVQYGFKKKYVRIIIYTLGIALTAALLVNSTMMDKLAFVLNNSYAANTTSAFTSGRSEFWKADLELFLSGNPIQLLVGRTFREVYVTNLQKVNLEIWSHNDIIHLLVGTGLIGAFSYVVVIYSSLVKAKENVHNKKIYFMLVLYVIFPMLLNGLFPYQHYLYSFVILYFIVITKEGTPER